MNTQGNGLVDSRNAESPQGEGSHPARLDGYGAQVRGIASTRPKPQTTTGATAEYLTAGQIAELLQVSEKSVYRWAAGDPTFPMLKIGGTVRFPRERILRWLRPHEQGGGQPRRRQKVSGAKAKSGKEAAGAE